jgi:prepilin-type N-terminal cleavage/methylation domain-containing protein
MPLALTGNFARPFLGRQAGFTFNEILVAISIIAVAILGYSLGTVGVIRGGVTNDNFTVAVNLAQDKMEQLKAQNSLGTINTCPDGGNRGITASGVAGGIFNRCWTVADSALGAKLRQVTVKVFWRDHEHREITIATLVFTG